MLNLPKRKKNPAHEQQFCIPFCKIIKLEAKQSFFWMSRRKCRDEYIFRNQTSYQGKKFDVY